MVQRSRHCSKRQRGVEGRVAAREQTGVVSERRSSRDGSACSQLLEGQS